MLAIDLKPNFALPSQLSICPSNPSRHQNRAVYLLSPSLRVPLTSCRPSLIAVSVVSDLLISSPTTGNSSLVVTNLISLLGFYLKISKQKLVYNVDFWNCLLYLM